MNEDGFQLLFMAVFLVGVIVYSILDWYRRKENQELKSVEFRIIAAENNLEYNEDGSYYLSRLSYRDLLPGKQVKLKNVVSRQHDTFVTRMFDASHVVGSGKSSKTEYLVGVAIEFEDVVFPRFDLDSAEFLDGFSFFDDMIKVRNESLPPWLKHNYSLFYKRQALPNEVLELFRDKEALKPYIDRPDFHLMAGGSKMLIYYRKGETESTVAFHNQMDSIGIDLANLFNQPISKAMPNMMSDEIKILKQSAQ